MLACWHADHVATGRLLTWDHLRSLCYRLSRSDYTATGSASSGSLWQQDDLIPFSFFSLSLSSKYALNDIVVYLDDHVILVTDQDGHAAVDAICYLSIFSIWWAHKEIYYRHGLIAGSMTNLMLAQEMGSRYLLFSLLKLCKWSQMISLMTIWRWKWS